MCVRLAVLVEDVEGGGLELERQEFTCFLTIDNQPFVHDVCIADGFENIADKIEEIARPGDLVITMGGGDIYKAAHIIQGRHAE